MINQNVVAAIASLIYVFSLIAVSERLVSSKIIISSTSRKIVHIGAASWLLFWPLFSEFEDGMMTWRLNAAIPAMKGIELFIKGAIVKDRTDKDVVAMSRSGNPEELLYGPLQFTVVMVYLGLYHFRQPVSCLIMGALGVGDGIAPIIGGKYGTRKIIGEKTLEGSFGVWIGTLIGYYVYSGVLSLPLLSFPSVCICAVVASVVEALAPPKLDNLAIPIAMYFSYQIVHH